MSDEITEEQWQKAKEHFDEVIAGYRELRGSLSGRVIDLLLSDFLEPMKWRFDVGERSRELYDEMLDVQ